ncbi:hypothetical protein [Frankia sp. Cr1]|uniref:hypothetical protein n=1 Tax=Frankia sp. Cr1 TaxID=3073931 RepID=UPI003A101E81
MHNLTVDDLHTYYVLASATPILVHNSGDCPTVGSVDDLMKNLDDDAIFHYSDQKGYEGILRSGTIRADSKGCAYVTQEMVSPGEIHNVFFAGNPAYAGKGGFMIAIRRREGVSFRIGEQPNELIHQGSLRFDRSDSWISSSASKLIRQTRKSGSITRITDTRASVLAQNVDTDWRVWVDTPVLDSPLEFIPAMMSIQGWFPHARQAAPIMIFSLCWLRCAIV